MARKKSKGECILPDNTHGCTVPELDVTLCVRQMQGWMEIKCTEMQPDRHGVWVDEKVSFRDSRGFESLIG